MRSGGGWLLEWQHMNAQLSLYDALVSANIPADKARTVVAALEQEMASVLATKSDLDHLRELSKQELAAVHDSLRHEFVAQRESTKKDLLLLQEGMTIRLGLMMAASISLLFAGLKFG